MSPRAPEHDGMGAVTSVVIGPEHHGVVRHATLVARASHAHVDRRHHLPRRGEGIACADLYHWHFTDRLFGSTIETAARALVEAMRVLGGRHVVSLHDVPAPNGTERSTRRVLAYRLLAAAADATIVASAHERNRLRRGGSQQLIDVIPLPVVDVPRPRSAPVATAPRIGVLGFVYPGKGHADVVVACSHLPADVRLCFLGTASDGHAALLDQLRWAAASAGRALEVTGFLDDAPLVPALERIDVPVVPARTTSASASVATWIGAGRRPLVARNGYSVELAARGEGLVTLYDPDGLDAALADALEHPSSTRRTAPVPPSLGLAAVAQAHREVYRRLLA